MRLLVWQLVLLAFVAGLCGYGNRQWWRNRGSTFGSFNWWKKSRRANGGWWW